jgi:hypothetical protein
MNVGIGTEAAQFLFQKVGFSVQCDNISRKVFGKFLRQKKAVVCWVYLPPTLCYRWWCSGGLPTVQHMGVIFQESYKKNYIKRNIELGHILCK